MKLANMTEPFGKKSIPLPEDRNYLLRCDQRSGRRELPCLKFCQVFWFRHQMRHDGQRLHDVTHDNAWDKNVTRSKSLECPAERVQCVYGKFGALRPKHIAVRSCLPKSSEQNAYSLAR